MKYLVLLAGCGLGDGSCIEEVILTYAALDKYGCDYTPVAEDVSIQGIDFLRRFYGSNLLAREMEELTAEKFCFDAENNVYYTPAFRKTNNSYTALLGVDSMICALKIKQK